MKSLMFMLVLIVGMTKLWWLGSHGDCIEARPVPNRPTVHRVALAGPPGGFAREGVAEGEREPAEGLPVPIYRGTRVTVAEIEPPRTDERAAPTVAEPGRAGRNDPSLATPLSLVDSRVVAGRISATETRARDDARVQLQHQVAAWLAPDVPASWKPPAPLIDRLIVRTEIEPVEKDYGTLYKATLHVDSSSPRRAEILGAYRHERVVHRMTLMGGALAAVLTCLAGLAGYIRADEATKGYYTNWLRAATAAGVGASGLLIYQWLA